MGVQITDQVRFTEPYATRTVRQATLLRENSDGTLVVKEHTTGGKRTLMPERCEVEMIGPRGGRRWISWRVGKQHLDAGEDNSTTAA